MNQEKYTERMRGFLQSAQRLALREGHQRFVPEHLLKVLLDDEEGLAANLIAGRRRRFPRRRIARSKPSSPSCPRSKAGRRPGLSGAGDGARLRPGRSSRREGRRLLRHRRASAAGAGAGQGHRRRPRRCQGAGVTPQALEQGHRRAAQGPHRRQRRGRERLRRAEEICPRPDRRRRARASSIR